jgi:hypothetical protein
MFRGIAAKLVGARRSQFAKGTRGVHMEEPNKPAPGGGEYYARGGTVDDDPEGASGLGIGYDQSPRTNTGRQGIAEQSYAWGGGVRGEIDEGGLDEAGDEGDGRRDHHLESYLAKGGEAGNEDTSWNEQDDDDMDEDEQHYADGGAVAGNGPDSSGRPRKKFWRDNSEPGLGVADAGSMEQWSRGIDPMVQPGGRDARVMAQKTLDGLGNQDHPAGENRERIGAAWEAVGHKAEWNKSDMRGTGFSSHDEGEPGDQEDEEYFAEGGEAEGEDDGASGGLMQCAQDLISAVQSGDAAGVARALKDAVELADED